MFESIVCKSFYGSDTPYVRGRLEDVDELMCAFDIPLEVLSDEERKELTEYVKKSEEIQKMVEEVADGIVFVEDSTLMDVNEDRIRFYIKGIVTAGEGKIAQASPRGYGVVHFQTKTDLEDQYYGKFDAKLNILNFVCQFIISRYMKDKIQQAIEGQEESQENTIH